MRYQIWVIGVQYPFHLLVDEKLEENKKPYYIVGVDSKGQTVHIKKSAIVAFSKLKEED